MVSQPVKVSLSLAAAQATALRSSCLMEIWSLLAEVCTVELWVTKVSFDELLTMIQTEENHATLVFEVLFEGESLIL